MKIKHFVVIWLSFSVKIGLCHGAVVGLNNTLGNDGPNRSGPSLEACLFNQPLLSDIGTELPRKPIVVYGHGSETERS